MAGKPRALVSPFLLAAVVALLGCGDGGVEPADVAGKYELASIAGAGLPRTVTGTACAGSTGSICVRASELWLVGDGSYVWWFWSDTRSSLLDAEGYYTSEGTWEVDGDRLLLDEPDGTTRQGRVSPSVTLELPGGTWLYKPLTER